MTTEPSIAESHRTDILAHVAAHPGCSLRSAAGAATLCVSVARYHVAVLERRKVLVVFRTGASWLLFPAGMHVPNEQVARVCRDPELRRLWTWLKTYSTVEQKVVLAQARAWGWHASSTKRRLDILLRAGLIHRFKEAGRLLQYRIAVEPVEQIG